MIHPLKWAALAAVLCSSFSTMTAQTQEIPITESLEEIAKQAASSESSPISESDITAAQQFGWVLQHRPLLRAAVNVPISFEQRPMIVRGFFTNSITFSQPAVQLTVSRRYNARLPELAAQLKVTLPDGVESSRQQRAEFA